MSPHTTRSATPHSELSSDTVVDVIAQIMSRFTNQLAAQSAAQISAACLSMMRRFEKMHTAPAQTPQNQPIPMHEQNQPSALEVRSTAGAPLPQRPQSNAYSPTFQPAHHTEAYAPRPQATTSVLFPALSAVASGAAAPHYAHLAEPYA